MPCPLCLADDCRDFARVDGIDYLRCPRCRLTWMTPSALPSPTQERAQYDLHENDPADSGYRAFLSRLAVPLTEMLPRASRGLDFGCGPGPALAAMLGEQGHAVTVYDPLYFPDETALAVDYDFITCTEVVEHLHQPAREFALFQRLLRPGGLLGIMTCWLTDDRRFAGWHYRRDPTHVCFYRVETLEWIAAAFGWELTLPRKDVALFRKPGSP